VTVHVPSSAVVAVVRQPVVAQPLRTTASEAPDTACVGADREPFSVIGMPASDRLGLVAVTTVVDAAAVSAGLDPYASTEAR
jgi:hypothetical protein